MTGWQVLDPRTEGEPVWWDGWRRTAALPANWAWQMIAAGEPGRYRLAVLRDESVRAVIGHEVAVTHIHVRAPNSSAQPGWWLESADPAERAALFREALRELRGDLRPAVLWRQLDEFDRHLVPTPLHSRVTEPVAVLTFPSSDYERWSQTLRAKRRRDLRRLTRRLDENPELTIRYAPIGVEAAPGELAVLARQNFSKYGAGRRELSSGPRSAAWQEAAAGRADITALTYRHDCGRLLAAMVLLEHPDRPTCLSWGAVPVRDGGITGLYFDMVHRTAKRAADAGRSQLVLGKGLAGLKEDLGAELIPQYAAIGLAW